MKKVLQIFAFFLAAIFYGQNISDYQYIKIEKKDGKEIKYGLNELLINKLKQKNYVVLSDNKADWQTELLQNPCKILSAEIANTSNMFRNKVTLSFKDCNNKTISSIEGKSMIKEFEPGMRDALENTMVDISPSIEQEKVVVQKEKISPTTNTAETPKEKAAEIVASVELSKLTEKIDTKPAEKIEVYSNGTLSLNKISLPNGEFILANPNTYVPFAIFKRTSQKETYRVQLSDKSTTIGYFENGNIVVELPNSEGNFRKEIFMKK